jgi:hypothetical protein
MRWYRILLAGAVTAALLLPTAAAAEGTRVTLDDMTCTGIGALGAGLPAGAAVQLTLVDRDNGKTLARKAVRTSSAGRFATRIDARLNQVLKLRVLVAGQDGKRIAFGDHEMAMGAAMCGLPFTGPRHAVPLLLAGGGSLAVGLLLLVAAARRPTVDAGPA